MPKLLCMATLMKCFHNRWSRRKWTSYYATINSSSECCRGVTVPHRRMGSRVLVQLKSDASIVSYGSHVYGMLATACTK